MTDPIEAAAHAVFDEHCARLGLRRMPWHQVEDSHKAEFIAYAKASLAAYRDAEIEALRAQVAAFKKYKMERECFTIDDWRIRAMNLEKSWSDCSRHCAKIQGERDNAHARIADLEARLATAEGELKIAKEKK